MPKFIKIILLTILVLAILVPLYLNSWLTFFLPQALPFQACGGIQPNAKSCISGFKCKTPMKEPVPSVPGTCQL